MTEPVHVTGVDADLHWVNQPERFEVAADRVTIDAGPRTDMFTDPANGEVTANAPALLTALPDGDHQLSARVTVGFGATFDAGVLLLWVDERRYGKLCFERSPAGRPMVVTVVTRGVSDDANAFTVDGDRCWLRISTMGRATACHASVDGQRWEMVRYFDLGADAQPRIGFQAQSPTGDGCRAAFDHAALRAGTLADLRDGS